MTTPIVKRITDEAIAEIEASARRVTLGGLGWYTELQLDDAIQSGDDIDYIAKMTPDSAQRLIGRLRAAESMLKFVLDNQIIVWEQNGMASGSVFCARWPGGYGAREWFPTRERAIQNAMDRLK